MPTAAEATPHHVETDPIGELAASLPMRAGGVREHVLDEEAVLVQSAQAAGLAVSRTAGRLHHLNAPAFLVWRMCDGRTPIGAAVTAIESRCFGSPTEPGADRTETLDQVRQLVARFAAEGLLEPCRTDFRPDRTTPPLRRST